jgi:AraC-like DNA-binding protein
MHLSEENKSRPRIIYSCYSARSREGEHFIPEHIFSYLISGSLIINDGNKEYSFREGDFRFSRRNRLAKFIKQPPEGGEFKSISVFLDQQALRNFSMEYGYQADGLYDEAAIMSLKPDPLYKSYMDSLMPYLDSSDPGNEALLSLKLKEAILILLKTKPALKDILFDFSEPGKIDLEAFMHKNYQFNVDLQRFAYLTGRSLATFKRDFEKIFHASPSRWLQQRRLQEAHYLIREKGKKPSDVYLELGFEDLSHFSFAFKKAYGVAPSLV